MPHLKAAVIGAGNMGQNHIRTISEMKDVKLCAIAETDEEKGKKIANQNSINFYNDYKELCEKENPDFVCVCVPTKYHHMVGKFFLENETHVLMEKPIASSIEEAQELLDIANKSGKKLLVGHIERFNPAIKKLKDMIKNQELGTITAIMARRVGGFPPQIRDADIAVDLAIHDIDIINYLLEDLPTEIYSNRQRNHIKNRDDSIEFFLKYKTTSAYIQTNWITPVKIRKLNITGSEGYLEMDYINQKIEFYKSNYDKFMEEVQDFSDYILRFSEPDKITIAVAKKEPLREEILFFVDAIKNDKKIDSKFALEALKIAIK